VLGTGVPKRSRVDALLVQHVESLLNGHAGVEGDNAATLGHHINDGARVEELGNASLCGGITVGFKGNAGSERAKEADGSERARKKGGGLKGG
jgi:hypothetical protein